MSEKVGHCSIIIPFVLGKKTPFVRGIIPLIKLACGEIGWPLNATNTGLSCLNQAFETRGMFKFDPQWNYTQIQDSQLKWPHMLYQWLCIHLIELYILTKYKLRIKGKENKPKGFHSYVVACNHISALDPPLVSLALNYQPISFLAKIELYDHFWMRLYNWGMSSIAVNRAKMDLSTVKSALKILKTGTWALGIFPEGTRAKEGEEKQNKRGVAFFACQAKVPILPLGIAQVERNGKKHMEVRVGKMIPYDGDMDSMAQKTEAAIASLVELAKTEP